MFYFVFPNSFTVDSYSWVLPVPEINSSSEYEEKQQITHQGKHSFAPTIILSPIPADCPSSTESHLKPLNSKNCSPLKQNENDQEYRPLSGNNKKVKKSRQMENRNVVPNIIRLILSYIQKKEKSLKLVQLLLKQYNITASSISSKRYYLFQKLVRGKINNYVNEETLKELYKVRAEDFEVYPQHEQLVYNRITRTLISEFMREEILTCILTSKRMESAKKRNHLEAIRTLKQKIRNLLQC